MAYIHPNWSSIFDPSSFYLFPHFFPQGLPMADGHNLPPLPLDMAHGGQKKFSFLNSQPKLTISTSPTPRTPSFFIENILNDRIKTVSPDSTSSHLKGKKDTFPLLFLSLSSLLSLSLSLLSLLLSLSLLQSDSLTIIPLWWLECNLPWDEMVKRIVCQEGWWVLYIVSTRTWEKREREDEKLWVGENVNDKNVLVTSERIIEDREFRTVL